MVLVHHPRTNNVLAMYWPSTLPLAPSDIVIGMLDGRKVVLAAGHWCRSCEKDKSEFDGDQSASAVPS
jgi:hypothetical protein